MILYQKCGVSPGAKATTRGFIIFVDPDFKDDPGLLPHEQVHVDQFWRHTTLTVSNIPASGTSYSFCLVLTNGGSAVVTWFSGVKWAGGAAPTLTTSGRDRVFFMTEDGGTTWDATIAKGFA
jgi:hypothetical protein